MRMLLAGTAAIALLSASALAQPGGGKGGGNGNGAEKAHGGAAHGPAAAGPAARGPDQHTERGGQPAAKAERRENSGPPMRQAAAPERGGEKMRGPADRVRPAEAPVPRMESPVRADNRGRDGDARPAVARGDRGATPFRWSSAPVRGLVNGCPPGLAKKNNGCMPPGQLRTDPWRAAYDRPDWWGYRGWNDGSYRYADGYLVRYDRNRILSYVPLLGGALAIGSLWPQSYQPVVLPDYYSDYYGYGPSYRYADDVIYRVDPETSAIQSIAALLTGNDLAVGQPLPDMYGVYNVPYDYRDRYVDGPDAIYRYSDGYIYQVDPTTRLVQAAIELLT